MSIEGKHAYRFGYLKSEEWQAMRQQCLVSDQFKCVVCEHENASNDAHHLFYRKNWKDTKPEDLVTLCRFCHEVIHGMSPKYLKSGAWSYKKFEVFRTRDGNRCCVCFMESSERKKIDKGNWICNDCAHQLTHTETHLGVWKRINILRQSRMTPMLRIARIDKLKRLLNTAGLERFNDIVGLRKALAVAENQIRVFLAIDKV